MNGGILGCCFLRGKQPTIPPIVPPVSGEFLGALGKLKNQTVPKSVPAIRGEKQTRKPARRKAGEGASWGFENLRLAPESNALPSARLQSPVLPVSVPTGSIKSPWRGVQRVGFLPKWPKSGVLGLFAGSGRLADHFVDANKMMPSRWRGEASAGKAALPADASSHRVG